MKNIFTAPFRAALILLLLFFALPASAGFSSITPYCKTHLYINTQSQTPPNTALYCQMQAAGASMFHYTGPVNGTMGVNSWKAMQRYLARDWGYTGPINGIPGPNTYRAMQRAGNAWGWYSTPNPVDGTMGLRDWRAWAYHIRDRFFGV